jgi:hypothetical protein
MGTLKRHSRADLARMIFTTRGVVQQLLFGGEVNVLSVVAGVAPLLDDSLDELEASELRACRENLTSPVPEHVVLDSSFRMLSLLESIQTRYGFERN